MIKEIEHLKRDYYENNSSLEDLGNRFDEMGTGFKMNYTEKKASQYEKCLFYDYKGKAKIIAILQKNEFLEQNIKIIRDVIKEYYEFCFFYDEVTGMLLADMIRLELKKHNVSYVSVIDLLHDTKRITIPMHCEEVKGENYMLTKKYEKE